MQRLPSEWLLTELVAVGVDGSPPRAIDRRDACLKSSDIASMFKR